MLQDLGKSSLAVLDMEAIADMVFRLLKAMNISVCQVVGHSMGGMLAQIISSKYNDLVKKLVLSCTFKGYGMSRSRVPLMDSYKQENIRKKPDCQMKSMENFVLGRCCLV